MKNQNKPQTVQQWLQWAAIFLGTEKRIEAELLLAKATGFSRAKLLAYPELKLADNEAARFRKLIELRKNDEPLQYLLGQTSFMGLDFIVNKHVLIPRSDTEVLVEHTLNLAAETEGPLSILDLCTGSGAIAISLAKYLPQALVTAVDISPAALEVAKSNARLNGVADRVQFLQGDLFAPVVENSFNIITANPPYISSAEMADLPGDVKKEPALALWGGTDGLDFYRRITGEGKKFLANHGWLIMEIGWKQGRKVKEMLINNGFTHCQVIRDWAGHDRVVSGKIHHF
ncbi:MAG: peptide chain release factor N(5)-glutamine methyltransferase [Clostridia bacterium]|nr:peptide chain release factor N(5)-glutamine methyltransferase [Clostridia bacterium]